MIKGTQVSKVLFKTSGERTSDVKGTVPLRFFYSCFFHESFSPEPLIITKGNFKFFSKIQKNIPVGTFT
jgi:hypothetical protein